MKRLRRGSRVARAYNDGSVVFLYDKEHVDTVGSSGAQILESLSDKAKRDPKLAKLARGQEEGFLSATSSSRTMSWTSR